MTESRSFSISISLTPEGFANRDEIISEIFKTIRLIEIQGIDRWRFDELKVVSDANFKFEEESDPQNVVTYLSQKLHSIPPQQLSLPVAAYLSNRRPTDQGHVELVNP